MAFDIKNFKSILDDMMNWIIANQSKLTDFNEGSVIRTFCEVIALELEQLYIRTRVGFEESFKEIPFYCFDFSRKEGQKASGEVVFSRSGTTGQVTIPIGTLVSTSDGTKFETTEIGTIADGFSSSNNVDIRAMEEGKDYNVSANTITTIVTYVTGVETVNNPSSTSGGQDSETDAEYLERFKEFINGLGMANRYGLVTGAKEVDGVRSASIIEHFPPSGGFNVTVYVDDGAGNAPPGMLTAVEDILVGDGTETNPGYKASGVNIRVLAPTKVTQNVTVEIDEDGTLAQSTVDYNARLAIEQYINNLLLGEDLIRNEIVKGIMQVPGVVDVTVTTPAGNVTVNNDQIARTGTITITFV